MGKTKLCSTPGYDNQSWKGGVCQTHGAERKLCCTPRDVMRWGLLGTPVFYFSLSNYSPIFIDITLLDCADDIESRLLEDYHYKITCMENETKHRIVVGSFTCNDALLHDIEIQISSPDSLFAHALCSSIDAQAPKKVHRLCIVLRC